VPVSEPLTKRLVFHRCVLASAGDRDATFVSWLREAYAIGEGAHLHQGSALPSP
jgi:hypothetical protein